MRTQRFWAPAPTLGCKQERGERLKKFWTIVENNNLYRKLNTHKVFGKVFNREIIAYVFFGVLTTIISFVVFWLFIMLLDKTGWFSGDSAGIAGLLEKHPWLEKMPSLSRSLQVIAANVVSWIFAVAFSFVTNKHFVFGSASHEPKLVIKELTAFLGARFFSLFAETATIVLLFNLLGINEIVAKGVAIVLVLALNYIFSKLFIFKKRD